MPWFRLEGRGAFHPKVIAAGDEAYGAWCRAGQWSCDQLTDGFISKPIAIQINRREKVWKKLVEVRLLEEVEGGYQIHDFHDWNPSAETERERREALREKRRAAGKVGGIKSGISRRGDSGANQDASDSAKQDGSKDEANVKQLASSDASGLLEANAKQNEAPSPKPIPISTEDPPNPPHVGGAKVGQPDLFGNPPAEPRKQRTKKPKATEEKPAHVRYAEAYAAGMRDATGEEYPPPRERTTLIDMARTYATHDGKPITGDDLLSWFRSTAREYRTTRAAKAEYEHGFAPHKCLQWLKSGRPGASTRNGYGYGSALLAASVPDDLDGLDIAGMVTR